MRKMLTIAAAAVVLGADAAVLAPAVRADSSRPFSGSGQGAITGQVPPATLLVDIAGSATHLGKFTRHEEINFTGPGTFVGSLTFVAADGDELDATFEGHFTDAANAVGTYTFTGGSGRFDDATGNADFAASTDGVNVWVSFSGTIDY